MRMTTHRVISTSGLLLSQDHLSPLAFRDVSSDHEHIQVVHIPLQQALIFMVAFKALINNCLNIWWHFLPQVFAREHRDNMQWVFAQCEAQRKILGHRALSQVWFSSLTRHLSLSFYQSRGSLLWTANVNFMGWTYRRIWRFFGIARVCPRIFFLGSKLGKNTKASLLKGRVTQRISWIEYWLRDKILLSIILLIEFLCSTVRMFPW